MATTIHTKRIKGSGPLTTKEMLTFVQGLPPEAQIFVSSTPDLMDPESWQLTAHYGEGLQESGRRAAPQVIQSTAG